MIISAFDLTDEQILNLSVLETAEYPKHIKDRSRELIQIELENNLLAQSLFWGPSDLEIQFQAILENNLDSKQ